MGGVVDGEEGGVWRFVGDPAGLVDTDEGILHPMDDHERLGDLLGDAAQVEGTGLLPAPPRLTKTTSNDGRRPWSLRGAHPTGSKIIWPAVGDGGGDPGSKAAARQA